jgi:thiosulfate reductase cytochrome b subunit
MTAESLPPDLPEEPPPARPNRVLVPRHALATRITHWINVVAFLVLLGSGLTIFNAHPHLYWGDASRFSSPWLSMTATADGAGRLRGQTHLGEATFDTTGLFGASRSVRGEMQARGFPKWMTVPARKSLSDGRRWHFFFAWLLVLNGLAYLVFGFLNRHIPRDLKVTRAELKTIPHEIVEHARLRFPKGEEARRYNVLQKLAYLAVIFVAFPLLILAGWAMSPGLNALADLPALFGGRQSARSIHFILAWGIVLFLVVHLVMVVASGTWNNIRSMITGRYAIEVPDGERADA